MSEEEIIKYIKTLNEITKKNNKKGIIVGLEISTDMADKLLNLIEKQDKIIDLIIDTLLDIDFGQDFNNCICSNIPVEICEKTPDGRCEQCIKEYFRKRVEEDAKN